MGDEYLAGILEQLKRQEQPSTTVRDLISHWNARSRGSRVVHLIARALDEHGLRTVPNFEQVGLDTTVRLERRPEDAANRSNSEYGLTIGALPSASGGTVHVPEGTSLEATHTIMQLHDYSQLPVMSDDRNPHGAVTWASIAQELIRNPEAQLHDCTFDPTIVDFDADLLHLTETIVREEFVLVRNQEKRIDGIVTTADVSCLFAERTEAFLTIGEIDQRLRDVIASKISIDQVRSICPRAEGSRPLETYDDMSMGDYQTVLGHPGCWDQIGWRLDRKVMQQALDTVRNVRNDVTHFNPDPPDEDELAVVAGLVKVLRDHA